MDYNTHNTSKTTPLSVPSKVDKGVSPVWANLIAKGITKGDKLKSGLESVRSDPSMLLKGYLGKSLLDKHINPFFRQMLPDSMEVDVLKRQFKFQPSNRFDMTLGKRGDTAKLGINWRF